MGKNKENKLSVFISLVLRHKPEAACITLDEHGWANVDELIEGINKSGHQITMEILEEIVRSDEKSRYSFNQDRTLIRANQGHSVKVDVGLKEEEPPSILYHGTAKRFLESIFKDGLRPMSRLYVHLSKNNETALNVGKRHGEPAVLQIDAGKMHRNGYKFYLSENGVWLTKEVPGMYCSNIIDMTKSKADEIEWQQIASIGKAYLDAAKKCSNPSIECMGWSHPLFIPIITNMAFACELFLKSLLKQHGKQLNNHRLLELFNELNKDLETEIIGSDNPKDFKCNLSKISNLFVDWRYIYEQPLAAIEFNFLSTLAERLLAVIEKHSEDNV